MTTRITMCAATVLWLASELAGAATPLPHEQPFRNLAVSVPPLAAAPTLDGTVDPAEWVSAGMMPRLIEYDREDRLMDDTTKFYIGYTKDALWLAWQIQRPKDAVAPKATITQPDRSFYRTDDAIEFMLNCRPHSKDRKNGRDFYMVWNALGTKYDRREAFDKEVTDFLRWNGDWQAVSRTVPEFGWEGEARFPLAMLEGAEPPGAGVRWRFQLCENRSTPEPFTALAGFQLTWADARLYPTLLFTGNEGVFVRVLDSGAMAAAGKGGVVLELVNPAAAAQTVVPTLKFYQRKPDAPSSQTYLRSSRRNARNPSARRPPRRPATLRSTRRVSSSSTAWRK